MNQHKFTGKADLYEKFRPGYPEELVDFLYDKTEYKAVADIGAGTGKFTRCLLKKPWKITAVEPNGDMREKLEAIEGITVVNASAENTGLEARSFGLVAAAQSFHWFDEEKFKEECKRILTDSGRVAIVWNSFIDEGLARRQTEICRKYSTDAHFRQTGHAGMREKDESDAFFAGYFKEFQKLEFFGERSFDRESFIGETLSRSYAPKLGQPDHERLVEELNMVFSEFESGGKAAVKCSTTLYFGKF
ncbi:MAG: class I SAM-dependent methyltransferase [Oscillospiraceae bacterium]|nr:class I SAM-dependent methyltransferase [Oscillospiraceae bacterium]